MLRRMRSGPHMQAWLAELERVKPAELKRLLQPATLGGMAWLKPNRESAEKEEINYRRRRAERLTKTGSPGPLAPTCSSAAAQLLSLQGLKESWQYHPLAQAHEGNALLALAGQLEPIELPGDPSLLDLALLGISLEYFAEVDVDATRWLHRLPRRASRSKGKLEEAGKLNLSEALARDLWRGLLPAKCPLEMASKAGSELGQALNAFPKRGDAAEAWKQLIWQGEDRLPSGAELDCSSVAGEELLALLQEISSGRADPSGQRRKERKRNQLSLCWAPWPAITAGREPEPPSAGASLILAMIIVHIGPQANYEQDARRWIMPSLTSMLQVEIAATWRPA